MIYFFIVAAYALGMCSGYMLSLAMTLRAEIRLSHNAPTLRRKNRNTPGRVANGQLMTDEEAAFARKLEDGYQPRPDGVRYEWINLTGEEGE